MYISRHPISTRSCRIQPYYIISRSDRLIRFLLARPLLLLSHNCKWSIVCRSLKWTIRGMAPVFLHSSKIWGCSIGREILDMGYSIFHIGSW
jgi:hypothetical protein